MEDQPLLGGIAEVQYQTVPHPTVDFKDDDPEDPMQWSRPYKMGIVLLLGFMAFTVTFTCNGLVPVAQGIVLELEGHESKSSAIMLVTIWELGEAAGPLFIAPLSEIFGRYPVFNAANILFIISVLLGAFSPSTSIFIFSRFLTGFAVASNVLNPAIIGDIFPTEQRGSPMSLIMLAPLLGGAIGPAIGGAIAESIGWRKILWISAVLAILCELCFFFLLRETYKVPILQKRALTMRRQSRDDSFKCAWETEKTGGTMCWVALRSAIIRPLTVMLDSVVLQIMSIYGAVFFAFFYVLSTTYPGILSDIYGFTPTMTGLSFLSFSLGAAGGIVICNLFLDKLYIKLGKTNGQRPEYRLPILVFAACLFPIIVALYGWIPYVVWPVALYQLNIAFLGFLMLLIMVPLAGYVVDAFGLYSASAMTMVLIVRCLAGTLLPLAIPPLVDGFGLGPGFLFLGGICLIMAPLPVLVMRYGGKWRQRSSYTRVD